MKPLVLMAAIAAVPVLLALILRVSAVFIFVSILAGDALVKFLSDDAVLALSPFLHSQYLNVIAGVILLTLPLVLTLFILRKSLARSAVVLQLIPLAANGLLLLVLLIPLLPSGVQGEFFQDPFGKQVRSFQDLIVGGTALLTLITMWLSFRHHESKRGKHRR